jgi:hypothetical protein
LFKTKKAAKKVVAQLSEPGKMPCFSYSLPAAECGVGSRLRSVEGSVCHGCYAHKGNYTRFPEVQKALYRRLKAIKDPLWIEAMTFLIKDQSYFRWHDSGDLMSEKHLEDILTICDNTPKTKHWLPTREYTIVENVLKKRKIPKNMALRLSAHMVDESGPVVLAKRLGVQISEVGTKKYTCPAGDQGGKCLDCRTCWSKKMNVIYHIH